MKPKFRSRALGATLAFISLSLAPALPAATLTWDANGATANQTDGSGAWLDANQWWTGAANTTWTSSDSAILGTAGTAGGAIPLASPTTVGSLAFSHFTGTYTLGTAGQTITLNSGITSNAYNLTTTTGSFASTVILGATQTWRNNTYSSLPGTGTGSLSLTGGVDLGSNTLTIDGIGTTSFSTDLNTNVITGGGGITKNGRGTLVLSGSAGSTTPAHTYSGTTTINGGVVRINNDNNSTGTGNLTINSGILESYSGGTYTRALGSGSGEIRILGGTSGFSGQGGTATTFNIGGSGANLQWGSTNFNPGVFVLQSASVNSNGMMTLANGIDFNGANREIASLGGDTTGGATVSGAIINSTGTAGLTKSGAGNLILTADNTYTGATTINGGWWYNNSAPALGTSNSTYTGWLTLSGSGAINSTSALNLSGGTLRLVNTAQTNRFADAAPIALGNGGGISYENTADGSSVYTETLGAVTVNSGLFNVALLNDFAADAGSQQLTLTGLTRTGANSSVVFFSAGNIATTAPSADKNIITISGKSGLGTGQGASAVIIGPWATTGGSRVLQTDYAVYDGSGNVLPAAITSSTSASWTDSTKAYSLNTGTLETLAADASANALQLYGAASELALGGFKLQTYGILLSGSNAKTISGGAITTPTGGGNLYVTTGRAIDHTLTTAVITDNSGAVSLVKSGTGRLFINGGNTYTGDTIINGGNLTIGGTTNGTPYAASLGGGAYAGKIQLNGGSTLQFRSSSDQTLSGEISGNGNLILQGAGAKTLSGANTYTGTTTVGAQGAAVGTLGIILNVSSFNSVFTDPGLGTVHSTSSSLGAPTTVQTGIITMGAGVQGAMTLRYTGSGETTDRALNIVFTGTAVYTIDADGSGPLKFVSTPMSNGTATSNITLRGDGNAELAGGLPFGFTNLVKADGGTWTLGGSVGSGNGTAGAGVLTINANGGTLALRKKSSLMGGDMTKWTAAKINVRNNSTLALNVDSADQNGISAGSLDTLLTNISVSGSSTTGLNSGARIGLDTSTATGGNFTQGNAIANSTGTNGGPIGLTKLGAGTLVFDKTNIYSGPTTVSGGTLALGANDVLPGSSAVSIGTATLNAATFTDTTGTLDVTAAATINLGTGAALAFSESSAVDWTGGTLNITGTLEATSLRFGTTSGGLSEDQLDLISVNGSGTGTYTLDDDGYLVAGGGSPYSTWSGGAAADVDTNNDGVDNGVAWALGAVDPDANAIGLLPVIDNTTDPAYVLFTFQRSDAAEADSNTAITVQYGTNLTNWTTAVDDNNNVEIEVTDASPSDTVVVKLKRSSLSSGGKLFARLNVVVTP